MKESHSGSRASVGSALPKMIPFLIASFVLALIADAIWLFGYALPRNPPVTPPTLPPYATSSQQQEFQLKLDRANVKQWNRERAVNTAIGIPIVVVMFALGGTLVAASRSHHAH